MIASFRNRSGRSSWGAQPLTSQSVEDVYDLSSIFISFFIYSIYVLIRFNLEYSYIYILLLTYTSYFLYEHILMNSLCFLRRGSPKTSKRLGRRTSLAAGRSSRGRRARPLRGSAPERAWRWLRRRRRGAPVARRVTLSKTSKTLKNEKKGLKSMNYMI